MPATTAPVVPLADGLLLRQAVPSDLEQIGELLTERGEPDDAVDHRLVVEDPEAGWESCAVVLDGDRVVSTATLLDERLYLGDVELPAGQVELVATARDHEGRGLVRALMAWAHARSADRGHVVQVMIGIPYFYRLFGYEYAIDIPPALPVSDPPRSPGAGAAGPGGRVARRRAGQPGGAEDAAGRRPGRVRREDAALAAAAPMVARPGLAGLVRYPEVAAGAIHHALRFTAPRTQQAHLWPARHDAGESTGEDLPPLGLRVRLKAGYDISPYPADVQVILQALKDYGMFLADNGSPWFITGQPNSRWDNDLLQDNLKQVHGSDFEAVDESSLMIDPNSGQSR